MESKDLEKLILDVKNLEVEKKKCFDGLIDKINKVLENYNDTVRASKEALSSLNNFVGVNDINTKSKEYKNLYNSISPTKKTKVTQNEYIKIKNKLPELNKIGKGW